VNHADACISIKPRENFQGDWGYAGCASRVLRRGRIGFPYQSFRNQAVNARQGRVSQAFDPVGPTALAINRPIKIKMPSST
jgi:hypothetical protein